LRLIDYLKQIENTLQRFSPILLTDIHLTEYTPYTGVIQGKITFSDGSILSFRGYLNFRLSIPKKTYSYHYQKGNELIFRYDSAPHHPEISTFPHHKHVGDSVLPASLPNLEQVLYEIIKDMIIKF
jgi:hypothetical protein